MDRMRNTYIVLRTVLAHDSICSFNKLLLLPIMCWAPISGVNNEPKIDINVCRHRVCLLFNKQIHPNTACQLEVNAMGKFKVGDGERVCQGQVTWTGYSFIYGGQGRLPSTKIRSK